jgi:PIN domain nuclease of toxin-antitoxin system
VANLFEYGRLELRSSLPEWLGQALGYPGSQVLELTPDVAIVSTQLPGELHHEPVDQIIVATARVYRCPLVTSDGRMLAYPHVETVT